jgi:hypothetical protein
MISLCPPFALSMQTLMEYLPVKKLTPMLDEQPIFQKSREKKEGQAHSVNF